MKRALVVTSLLLSGCTFLRGNNAPSAAGGLARPANDFQASYYRIEEASPGRYKCTPNGPLAELETAGCLADLPGCAKGIDVASGKADPQTVKLFADTLTRTDTAFAYQCIGLSRPASGPENLHRMGLVGLGLAGDSGHIDRELALDVQSQRDSDWHKAMRGDLAFALWQTRNQEKALPKLIELAQMPGTDDSQRAAMILYVGRWGNNGLVDMCAKELAEPASNETGHACAWYIAHVKAPDAVSMIAKADARIGLAQIRALGWTGDAKAAEALNRFSVATATDTQRVVARVALLNIGKKDSLKEFLAMLGGNIPGKRNADNKLGTDELAFEAAMETLALANRSFDKDIVKALQKLTSSKNEQTATAAWIALAYLNDQQGLENLNAVLAGADDSLRKMILDNTGAQSDAPGRRYTTGSNGVIPSKAYAEAIAATFSAAQVNNEGRAQAARAIAAINTATRAE